VQVYENDVSGARQGNGASRAGWSDEPLPLVAAEEYDCRRVRDSFENKFGRPFESIDGNDPPPLASTSLAAVNHVAQTYAGDSEATHLSYNELDTLGDRRRRRCAAGFLRQNDRKCSAYGCHILAEQHLSA